MTCRGFIQLLLKVINVLFTLVGLAMIGYGIYMVVRDSSSSTSPPPPPPPSPPPPSPPPPPPSPSPPPPPSPSPPPPSPPSPSPPPPSPSPPPPSPPPPSDVSYVMYRSPPSFNKEKELADNTASVLQLRRALLQHSSSELSSLSSFWSSLATAWFLYVFIGVGVIITLITCSGCVAASTVNGCCLSCYAFFVGVVMIFELALAAFIFFYGDWQDVMPEDSTGELDSIESFIENKFDILKWVALAIIILQAIALFLAITLRALGLNARTDYDSDDEYLAMRSSRQPLLNRQGAAGTGINIGSSDTHSRADAWSTRMREKYGLDTKEFSYNPSESKRYPQQSTGGEENRSKCTIM